MTAKPGFEIHSDTAHNLLRIAYHGHATVTVAKELADQVRKLVLQMRPGFTVLTDLTHMESMALGCVPHLTAIMELCKAQGIGTTIRVIPDPRKDIGLTILSHTRYGTAVRIVTCQTLAEAEAALKVSARPRK